MSISPSEILYTNCLGLGSLMTDIIDTYHILWKGVRYPKLLFVKNDFNVF